MRNSLDEFLSNKWRQLAAYVLLFVVAFVACYIWFALAGKSFVWQVDGRQQHFPAFIYLGKWIRSIVCGFVSSGSLTIPMFDFGIGYGSDVISTFSYYGLGEPLVWLSALCPIKYAEFLYCALIIVRLFLAGLFFLSFCRYLKCSPTGSTVAAVVYAFSSWALYAGVRHPFFLLPLIFLPLILFGAEKIVRKESPAIFMVAVFLSSLSNFYFFYMLAIAVFLYVLVRFACMPHEHLFKEFATLFAKFLVYGIVGFLMAGILMVPVLLMVVGGSRTGVEVLTAAYPIVYYQRLIVEGFTSAGQPHTWIFCGVSAPAALAVVYLFVNKGNRELKILIVLLMVFLLIPQASYVLNGMSYAAGRWTWMVSFALSFTLAVMWNKLLQPRLKNIFVAAVVLAIYVFLVHRFERSGIAMTYASMALLVLFFLYTVVMFVVDRLVAMRKSGLVYGRQSLGSLNGNIFLRRDAKRDRGDLFLHRQFSQIKNCLVYIVAACFVVYGAGMNAYYLFDSAQQGYVNEFIDSGKALSAITKDNAVKAKTCMNQDSSFSRLDAQDLGNNYGVLLGLPNTNFLWSLCDSYTSNYLKDMETGDPYSFTFFSTNQRTYLSELASVRYFSGDKSNAPYGYTEISPGLYQNQDALPLGYAYSSAISSADYENMSALQKQEALMQGVVFHDDSSGLKKSTIKSSLHGLAYSVQAGEGVDNIEGSIFMVGKAQSSITLDVECPAGEEIYLNMSGMNAEAKPLLDLYKDDNQNVLSKAEYKKLSKAEKKSLKQRKKAFAADSVKSFTMGVTCGETSTSWTYLTPYHSQHRGQTNFAVCLGTSNEARTSITITFSTPGIYDLGDLGVYAQPMTNYVSQVNKLKEDVLENVKFGTNEVSGTINLKQSKALLLTIPYSEGWSATVDGEPAELHRANGMFMALSLKAGGHQVELNYKTKGLDVGIALSLVGLTAFAGILLYRKMRGGE